MGLDVGQVRHPEPVLAPLRPEAALDEVSEAVLALVEAGGDLVGPFPACSGKPRSRIRTSAVPSRPARNTLAVELSPTLSAHRP